MSSVADANQIAIATGRKAVLIEAFSDCEDFAAIGRARAYLTKHGYTIGPMCRDEPIACSSKAEYIAKWRNIGRDEWSGIEAVIVSEDMRNGPAVYIYEFVKE